MAISRSATAWNTSGTYLGNGSNQGMYKDLAVTAAVGDLLVVQAVGENNNNNVSSRTVTTQTGTAGRTGSWTIQTPAIVNNSDVSFVAAYALVTTAGSVTVRGKVDATASSERMGVEVFLVPAAEVGATYGFYGSGYVGDADGQFGVTLSGGGTQTVIQLAGDWSALNPGSTVTPSGGTVGTSYFDTNNYAVFSAYWTGQAAGTRNYGPSGLSGRDFSGSIFRMDEVSTGVTGTATSTLPSFTQAASGTVVAPAVTGTATSTLPSFTQAAEGSVSDPGGNYSPSAWGTANATLVDPEPIPAPAYRWNGSMYVALDTYRWNGTAYIPIDTA